MSVEVLGRTLGSDGALPVGHELIPGVLGLLERWADGDANGPDAPYAHGLDVGEVTMGSVTFVDPGDLSHGPALEVVLHGDRQPTSHHAAERDGTVYTAHGELQPEAVRALMKRLAEVAISDSN